MGGCVCGVNNSRLYSTLCTSEAALACGAHSVPAARKKHVQCTLPAETDRQLKAPTPSPPPPNGDFHFGRVVVSVAAGDSFFGEGWCAELGIVY